MTSKGLWIGLLLTLVFLALAFRGVDLAALSEALARANYLYVVPATAFTALGYGARTARWRVILSSEAPMPFVQLLRVLVIGFAANNVLPARLGEVIRALLLRRHGGVRKSFALATIFLERVADGLTLLCLLVLLSANGLIPGISDQRDRMEIIAAVVFVGLALAMWLALARRELVVRLVEVMLRLVPRAIAARLSSVLAGFLDGIESMRSMRRLAAVAALSLVVWSLEALAYFTLTLAFGLQFDLPTRIVLACSVLVLVNLSIMIPSAPGYIGTFHLFASSAVGLFGVPTETALAYAIVAHASQYILITATGAAFVGRERLSWGALKDEHDETSAPYPVRRADEATESLVH